MSAAYAQVFMVHFLQWVFFIQLEIPKILKQMVQKFHGNKTRNCLTSKKQTIHLKVLEILEESQMEW